MLLEVSTVTFSSLQRHLTRVTKVTLVTRVTRVLVPSRLCNAENVSVISLQRTRMNTRGASHIFVFIYPQSEKKYP